MASLTELKAQSAAGEPLKFIFFWSEGKAPIDAPDKGCFSQWYPAAFTIDGISYPTAEHYMMAEKARLFGATDVLEQILAAPHPGAAKALGRQISGFDETRWIEHRFAIVVRGNRAKFSQNEALGSYLRASGKRVLVEASPRDDIWGIGLAQDHPDARDPTKWRGLNLLGFALMAVRDEWLTRQDA